MKVAHKKELYRVEKTEKCILEVLAYFSIFDYPLTKDEIQKYLPQARRTTSVNNALSHLVSDKAIFIIDGFYLLRNDPALVLKRKMGNSRARQMMPKAIKIGRFLSRFPYVRGIGISGSLSKDYADERTDFDFFIITRGNRLWIARTLMHLFKKLTYVAGKQHEYCMNYYIDEESLRLRDQNIYTAIEIFTLIPVAGNAIGDFFTANSWVRNYFAAYPGSQFQLRTKEGRAKRFLEWMMNNKMGDKLDNLFMRITSRRWKKKEQQHRLNRVGKEMSLVTGKHYAWSNSGSFQEKIVEAYDKKVAELRTSWPQYFQPLNLSFEE